MNLFSICHEYIVETTATTMRGADAKASSPRMLINDSPLFHRHRGSHTEPRACTYSYMLTFESENDRRPLWQRVSRKRGEGGERERKKERTKNSLNRVIERLVRQKRCMRHRFFVHRQFLFNLTFITSSRFIRLCTFYRKKFIRTF